MGCRRVAIVLGGLRAADSSPSLTATFIGNMAFADHGRRTTLYTDFPYESGYSGYMTYDFGAVPKAKDSLCLITHRHRDHFDSGASGEDELPRNRSGRRRPVAACRGAIPSRRHA